MGTMWQTAVCEVGLCSGVVNGEGGTGHYSTTWPGECGRAPGAATLAVDPFLVGDSGEMQTADLALP